MNRKFFLKFFFIGATAFTLSQMSVQEDGKTFLQLNGLLDRGFVAFWSVDWSRNSTFTANSRLSTISVQFKEFTDVEFGLLEDFDFPDVDIMERVDALAGLLNVLADGVRDQLADNLCRYD